MKEKEFERRLDKKIQGHAKIMSDEKHRIYVRIIKLLLYHFRGEKECEYMKSIKKRQK